MLLTRRFLCIYCTYVISLVRASRHTCTQTLGFCGMKTWRRHQSANPVCVTSLDPATSHTLEEEDDDDDDDDDHDDFKL